MAGAKLPVHSFLGGKGLGVQQGMSVWVGLPKLLLHGLQVCNRAPKGILVTVRSGASFTLRRSQACTSNYLPLDKVFFRSAGR